MTTQDNTQFDSLTSGELSALMLEVVSVLIEKHGLTDENKALLVSAIETVAETHGIGVKFH